MVEERDPSRCPLCGRANECGVVAGTTTCWCFNQSIPREVLERARAVAGEAACVCRACASGEAVEKTAELQQLGKPRADVS